MKFNVSVLGLCFAALLSACGGGDPYDAGAHKVTYVAQASNFVGNGNYGDGDGTGNDVQFSNPNAVALASNGDLYVADGNQIRKVTDAGVVSTVAKINNTGFFGVAVDSTGNIFASSYTNVIYKISAATPPEVTIYAGMDGAPGLVDSLNPLSAKFDSPKGMAIDRDDNLYIADSNNNAIRKIARDGAVSTVAGTGFNHPAAIAVDVSGNLYIADTYNNVIRKISATGFVTTVAGSGVRAYADGTGNAASFNIPQGITIDKNGNLIVADTGNHSIRTVTVSGVVTTLAGDGETAGLSNDIDWRAKFDSPMGIAVSPNPGPNVKFYLADNGNRRIRLLKMIWI
jgi:sugar lactone lactonase YvrE